MSRDAPAETAGQLAQGGPGVRRVGESEHGEALLGQLGRERAGAGERLEDRREEQPLVDRADGCLMRPLVRLERFERGRSGRSR